MAIVAPVQPIEIRTDEAGRPRLEGVWPEHTEFTSEVILAAPRITRLPESSSIVIRLHGTGARYRLTEYDAIREVHTAILEAWV